MKNITTIVAESGQIKDLSIQPGTTSREVLNHLGLDQHYVLSLGRGNEPFGDDENIYPRIADGAKLIASTPVEVGMSSLVHTVSRNSRVIDGAAMMIPSPSQIVVTGTRSVVPRDTRPYWKQRGWTRSGNTFEGYYRTTHGAWRGRATASPSNRIELFIHQPPHALRFHPHWVCFREQNDGWFFVHTTEEVPDLSSGVLTLERILTEAHAL